MKNPYEVLGVSPGATPEEIKAAYHALARRNHPDNFANDPVARTAAEEKMKEINEAYDNLTNNRAGAQTGGASATTAAVREKIRHGLFAEAEVMLETIPAERRGAEWHYLKSILLMRRGWQNDAMQEIGIACAMDPDNTEYRHARETFTRRYAAFGENYRGSRAENDRRRAQGGDCTVCDVCSALFCADCCCESFGFDLIRCL